VALFREDGSALAQTAANVDFEPAAEWTRLLGLRSGLSVQQSYTGECVPEPVWDEELGEPYLGEVRMSLRTEPGGNGLGHTFSTALFHGAAQAAGSRLVEEGKLKDGDRFIFRPLAFPRPLSEETEEGAGFGARQRPPALSVVKGPLDQFLDRSNAQRDLSDSDDPLFVPGRVLEGATALAVEAGDQETGGILIGFIRRDPIAGGLFTEITAQIPAEYAEGTATRLSFTADAWTAVRAALDLRQRGESMLGWWHSHVQNALCPDCSEEKRAVCRYRENFFSAHDHALHRTIFPRAYSMALVVNVVTAGPPTHSLFGWREGLIQPRGFHVLGDVPLALATEHG